MNRRLGNLYRRYLRGSDLTAQVTVTIVSVQMVEVQPHPTAPKTEKACLIVSGLAPDLPNAILFGPQGEGDLVIIFGNIDISELAGKRLTLTTSQVKVNGEMKKTIRFKAAAPEQPPASPAPGPGRPAAPAAPPRTTPPQTNSARALMPPPAPSKAPPPEPDSKYEPPF